MGGRGRDLPHPRPKGGGVPFRVARPCLTRFSKKKSWGQLTGVWVPRGTRDAIIGYVRTWSDKRNIPVSLFVRWLGISAGKYHDWEHRFGFAWLG